MDKDKFLEPETRSGYFISAEKKAAMKCMLDILEVFMAICKKYNLNWYMEAGSLLGAVRHGGFIPWDDDIDVAMPRKDYDKLQELLPSELPSDLFMQTSGTDPELLAPLLKIRNKNTCAIDPYHAKNHVCMNMGIMVDVDPIDVDPINKDLREKLTRHDIFLRGLRRNAFSRAALGLSGKFKKFAALVLYGTIGNKLLYKWRERPYRKMAGRSSIKCVRVNLGQIGYVERWNRKAEWYNEYIEVPFEYLTVRVPAKFDEILTRTYGDWRTPCQEPALHGTLVIDANRCFKDVLKDRFGYKEKELAKIR